MILITTAGKVGAEAARLLAAQGEPVRVLARNPEKVAVLSQAGVEVVEGDLEVPASIDAAMRGVSSVILVSLAIPNQKLNVVDSALRAGVDHVVKITSKASADSPIARRRGQTEIEEGLIASGLGRAPTPAAAADRRSNDSMRATGRRQASSATCSTVGRLLERPRGASDERNRAMPAADTPLLSRRSQRSRCRRNRLRTRRAQRVPTPSGALRAWIPRDALDALRRGLGRGLPLATHNPP